MSELDVIASFRTFLNVENVRATVNCRTAGNVLNAVQHMTDVKNMNLVTIATSRKNN